MTPRKLATEQPTKPWKARPITVKLYSDHSGQWWQVISDGNPLPATDVSVALWRALKEAEREIERLRGELNDV